MKKKGFTLLEMMIALAIAAIIMSAGLAPLLYTTRMIRDAREKFTQSNRERTAANRIFADIRGAVSLNEKFPAVIKPYDDLSRGENDFLIVRTSVTANAASPLSSAVWGVPADTVLSDFKPGLYRWVISSDISPGGVAIKELDPAGAALILPGVSEVSFHALSGPEWTREYSGPAPRALRVTFGYADDKIVYEEILPNF